MTILKRGAAALCGACLSLIAIPAAAGDVRSTLGPALQPGQAYDGRIMKGAVLARCRTLDDEIHRLDTRLQTLQSTMDVHSRSIESLDVELDAARATLDTSDADAVHSFNDRVERQRAIMARHDALLPEHQALVERQNPRVEEFNGKCAGLAYYLKEWVNVRFEEDPDLMPPATDF